MEAKGLVPDEELPDVRWASHELPDGKTHSLGEGWIDEERGSPNLLDQQKLRNRRRRRVYRILGKMTRAEGLAEMLRKFPEGTRPTYSRFSRYLKRQRGVPHKLVVPLLCALCDAKLLVWQMPKPGDDGYVALRRRTMEWLRSTKAQMAQA